MSPAMPSEKPEAITAVTLRSERLLLRPPRRSDAGPMHLYASDARVANMTTAIPHPYPPGAAEAFIGAALSGRGRETVWSIDATPDQNSELVGVIALRVDRPEIGYWVGPPFWGTGYATEAATMLCDHLLGPGGLTHVTACVFFDNPASQRVLKRAGFRQCGDRWLHSVARGIDVPSLCFERRADAAGHEPA